MSRNLVARIDGDVSGFTKAVKSAEQSAKTFERELKRIEQRQTASVAHVTQMRSRYEAQAARAEAEAGRRREATLGAVGTASMVAGAAVAAGIGLAVKSYADFDASMSRVKAATGEGAAGMNLLRAAAIDAGQSTAFSATDAASAIEQLSKAGVTTAAILGGGLSGALDLAAAGSLDVGTAAELAATAMTQFGLTGGQVPHIADLLAAAAGKAQGEVADMGMALKQAGLVANQTGLSIEETTAGLAAFASAGLIGSDAGTSFKSMLQRLTPQSDEAASEMERLGISAYDAQGNFIGLEAFAGNLQQSMSGLTVEQRNAAMATIFGSDAVRAASVLYEQGATGIADWTEKVNDSGFAARTAATLTDNLAGDVEKLGGALSSALIDNGSGANAVLRALVQTATGGVQVFSDLPGPVQAGATGVAALASAAGLASGAFLLGAPKVAAFKDALGDMGPRAQKFGGGLLRAGGALGGPWGIALAAGVTALGFFAKAKADAKAEVDAFTEAIQRDSGVIGENARQTAVAALEKDGLLKAAQDLNFSLSDVTDAAIGDAEAMANLRVLVDSYEEAARRSVTTTELQSGGLDATSRALTNTSFSASDLLGRVEELSGRTVEGADAARRQAEALGEQGGAAEGAAGPTSTAAGAQQELADSTKAAVEALDAQATALRAQYDPVFAMEQALIAHGEAQNAVKEATKEHGAKSREAAEAEWALFEATVGLSGASTTLTSAVTGSATSVDAARAQLNRWVQQGLITQGQADTLAGRIGGLTTRAGELTDTPATLKVGEQGIARTKEELAILRHHMRELDGKTATVTTVYRSIGAPGAAPVSRVVGRGGGLVERAGGGPVFGPGTETSDSIPALLSNDEHVWTAREVRAAGGHDAVERMRRAAVRGFAQGGRVQRLATARFALGGAVRPIPTGQTLLATPVNADAVSQVREFVGHWS